MKLVAICPTYRRQHLILNVLAMWEAQDYVGQRHLLILDDGREFVDLSASARTGPDWSIAVAHQRYPSLGEKFATLVDLAISEHGATHIVLFEDDDVYGPQYLSAHSAALNHSHLSMPLTVLANDHAGRGKWHLTHAVGRHHGAWAFSVRAYRESGGYERNNNHGFDTHLGNRLRSRYTAADTFPGVSESEPGRCHYLYRWFTAGQKNGSAYSEGMYASQTQPAVPWPADRPIVPEFDAETTGYYSSLWGVTT